MDEDRGRVRFHWKPLVRGRNDPRSSHPGHFLDHFPLLGLLTDMLDDRVGEREVDIIVLKRHIAGIGDHEGVRGDSRLDVDAHLHVIAVGDPLLHDAGVYHIGIARMLVTHSADKQDIPDALALKPGGDIRSLAVAVTHAVPEHSLTDVLLESLGYRHRSARRCHNTDANEDIQKPHQRGV